MNCLPCFQSKNDEEEGNGENQNLPVAQPKETPPSPSSSPSPPPPAVNNEPEQDPSFNEESERKTKNFTFRELAMATKNFRQECLLGEGGFGRIFKGTLKENGQIVAVRQLDRNGLQQGGQDFIMEVANLNMLEHKNLVNLVGYCADGDQRLLVYDYMPMGSLKAHLFDIPSGKKPLDWTTRMKIALGVADGLEYLHEKADPPIIYRDLKSSNILLTEDNAPKLSEYGLANLGPPVNKMHTPRVISHGYCAPEYEKNGELTMKSDVYSFGVVLLELISGRKALDPTKPEDEQNLVDWAQPYFKDQTKFAEMADPLLRNRFSATSLNQAVGVAAMCLQEEPSARPLISDISAALSFLAMAPPEAPIPARLVPILSARVDSLSQHSNNTSSKDNFSGCIRKGSESSDDSDSDDEDKHKSSKSKSKKLGSSVKRHKSKKKKNKSVSKKSRSSSLSSSSSRHDMEEESHDNDYGSSSDDEEERLEEEDEEEEEEEDDDDDEQQEQERDDDADSE